MAKNKKDDFKDFFSEDKEEAPQEKVVKSEEKSFDVKMPEYGKQKKAKAEVVLISGTSYLIVKVDGNNQRIPYNKEKHSALKIGDPIDV
jgi:hypothetical protein